MIFSLQNCFIKVVSRMVHFNIQPRIQYQLVDQLCKIRIENLEKGEKYSVIASLCENKSHFYSRGDYHVSDSGTLDFSKDASFSGTYTGIEPMGLFWSMQPVPGQNRGIRLMKKDVETPFKYQLYLIKTPDHTNYVNPNDSGIEASTTLERWYMDKSSVKRKPIKIGRIRGTLFLPQGPGPFPTILDMFGTAGGLLEFRSALLASHGIASLALAYFNYDDLPKEMSIDFDYFMEAMSWLSEQSFTKNQNIGVVGVSKGAELACLCGIYFDKVKAVVSMSGAQCLSGIDIPFKNNIIKSVNFLTKSAYEYGNEGYVFPMPEIQDSDVFPIEKSSASFLFLCGAEDPLCGPWCIDSLVDRLQKFKKNNWEMFIYPAAGHLIEPPYTPCCRFSYHKLLGDCMFWGGHPKPHSLAQEHSWRAMIAFLKKCLDVKSKL